MQIAKHLKQATVDHPVSKKHRCSIQPAHSDLRINPKSHSLASLATSSSDISILATGDTSLLSADHLICDTFSNSQHSLDSPSSNLNNTRLSSPTGSSFSQADFLDEVRSTFDEFSWIDVVNCKYKWRGVYCKVIYCKEKLFKIKHFFSLKPLFLSS